MTERTNLLRNARQVIARLSSLRVTNVPDAPALPVRDSWPGEPARGARIVRGEIEWRGIVRPLRPGGFGETERQGSQNGSQNARIAGHIHSFLWLRDLRALGTDNARMRARALIGDWMAAPALPAIAMAPDVAGSRLAAWLAHYDFFAASAEDEFRQALMARLVTDARQLSAIMPAEERDGRALTALKGLIAASVALPEHAPYLARALRFLAPEIDRQVLPDGCHIERSPAAHLAALQDLTEIRALLQSARAEAPPELPGAIERMALALRSLRHGDGGLALFNGSSEDWPNLIDLVLAQAGRTGRSAAALTEGGFYRLAAGKNLAIVDGGVPAPSGADRFAHAGTLSFEFSIGRERLIVNCGSSAVPGADWRDALRATAAHSTLVIADVSSAELRPEGLGRRPMRVEVERQEANGAHWFEASHDGWMKPFGAIHRRRLYLAESGEDLRGEDWIEARYSFARTGGKQPLGEALIFGERRGTEAKHADRDVMTIRTEYPYQTLRIRTGGDKPVMDLWIAYTPQDEAQRRNRTFGLLSVRKPKIPGLLQAAWPLLVLFTERIFREDREIVEMEQAAHDAQGEDRNQEVFPVIRNLRALLMARGIEAA